MVASTDILFFSSRRNRPFQNAALCTGNGTLMGNPTRRMANANCRTPNATCTLRNLSYATQIVVRDLTRTLRNSSYATQLVIRYATRRTQLVVRYATRRTLRNSSFATQLVVRYATRRSLRNSGGRIRVTKSGLHYQSANSGKMLGHSRNMGVVSSDYDVSADHLEQLTSSKRWKNHPKRQISPTFEKSP